MSESPLDGLLSRIDAALEGNAAVVAEADRAMSGSPYMSVLRANRAEVEAKATRRAHDREMARSQRSDGRSRSR